ncbi:MAG: PKD domain-containing protein, partial [Pseudomonadota bacterium]
MDGGYIVAGVKQIWQQAGFNQPGQIGVSYLMKANASGDLVWRDEFQDAEFYSVVPLKGYGPSGERHYLSVGTKYVEVENQTPNMTPKVLMIHTVTDTAGGNRSHESYTFDFPGLPGSYPRPFSVQQISSDRVIVGSNPGSLWEVKVGPGTPTIIRQKTFFENAGFYSAYKTADGGYIMFWAGKLIKTTSDFTEQWQKFVNDNPFWSVHGFWPTADGGYILTGTGFGGGTDQDVVLSKLDSAGVEQWRHYFDYDEATVDNSGGFVRQAADGGYIVVGWSQVPGSGIGNVVTYVLKTDAQGQIGPLGTWEQIIKVDAVDWWNYIFNPADVEVTQDQSAIIVGLTAYPGVINRVALLKTIPLAEIKKELRVKDIRLYTTLKKPSPLQDKETLLEDPVFIDGISVPVKFRLLVDWGDEEAGKVVFTTPKGTYEVPGQKGDKRYTEQSGKELDVGQEFGVGGKLTVKAVGASGRESKLKEYAPIVASPPMGVSRDAILWMFSWDKYALEYGLGPGGVAGLVSNEFGGLVPENIPMLGSKKDASPDEKKKKGSVDVTPKVKGSLDLEGSGSLEIGVVLKPADSDGDSGSAGFGGVAAAVKAGKKAGKVGKPKVEVSLEITGGVAFSYKPATGNWAYGGTLGLGLSGYMETAPYYVFVAVGPVVIPFYARAGAGMDVHNQLTLLFLDASGGLSFMDPEWSGEFDLDVYGKIMAGIGVADVLAVEVYGKAGVHLELQYPNEPIMKKLSIPVEAGINVVVVIWSYSRKFWEYEWVLKSNPGEYWVKQGVPPEDLGEFTPIPRDYLSSGEPYARFYPQTINPVSVEKALQTNVYPYSQPAIVSQDGNVFAFWIYDDPARSSLNRTKLVYSRLEEGIWSTPRAVWDDGTLDLRPQAAFLPDGRMLVVWENLNSQLSDGAELGDALPRMEMAYGVYDTATDTWQAANLTSDGYYDHSPKLSAAQDETALLTWTRNKANSLFGSLDKPDTLSYALWNGSWSAPSEILTVSKPVIKSSLGYDGTKGYLIWESEEDNDLGTLNDRELRMLQFTRGVGWGAESLLTSNDYLDANPQVLFDDGIPVLFWLKDDDVAMARNLDLARATTAVGDVLSGGGVGFKAMSRPNGLMLFWADGSEEGADIYVARWDRATSRWGMRQQLTTDGLVERDIEGTVLDTNRFVLIYDKVTISYPPGGLEGEGIPEPQKTDLYFMTYEDRVDLMANYLFLSNPRTESEGISDPTPVPGDTVTLTVEVGNAGDTVERDIPVLFYQGGKYIGRATVTGYLAPGQVGRASLSWTVPEQRTLSISAQIDPAYAPDDADRRNDVIGREITTKMLANPVAAFTYSPLAPKPGQALTFDASASYDPDGSITRYTWEFGDDQTAEGKIVTYTYQEEGEYDVLLKVRDNKALGGTIIRTVFVVEEGGAPPPPPSNMFTDLIINPGETKELTEDIFVSGKLINNGNFQPGNYNIMLVGDGTQEIKGNVPGKIVHSGSGTLQLTGSLTVGEFLNLAGNFNANGHTMTASGPAAVSGGTYQAGTGTQTFNDGLTVSGGTFVGSSGGVHVNGNLTLSGGALSAPDTLYVSGNWLQAGGTFNHNNKTVVFNGSTGQLITGNNTF